MRLILLYYWHCLMTNMCEFIGVKVLELRGIIIGGVPRLVFGCCVECLNKYLGLLGQCSGWFSWFPRPCSLYQHILAVLGSRELDKAVVILVLKTIANCIVLVFSCMFIVCKSCILEMNFWTCKPVCFEDYCKTHCIAEKVLFWLLLLLLLLL